MAQWRITAADGRKFKLDAATDLAARYFAEQKGIIVTSVEPLDEEAAQLPQAGGPPLAAPYQPSHAASTPRASDDMAETIRSLDARVAAISEALHRNSWMADRRLYFSTTRNAVMWGVVLAWLFITAVMFLLMIVLSSLGALGIFGALSNAAP